MKLLCVGDVAVGDDTSLPGPWEPLTSLTSEDELRIVFNWELPVGSSINPTPRSSGPRLLACQGAVQVIRSWVPGFATIATNHILDGGVDGLVNTINSLNEQGFATVGAGRTNEEIEKALFWETSEGRLAIVNWVFPETHPDWQSVPGPNCWPGPEKAKRIIQELKQGADWVLVIVHWSDEDFPYPRPKDRDVAGELARAGADMVIGHHPHVVRGMEIIGSCPVFYSLGNLYFSEFTINRSGFEVKQAPRNREGLGVYISFRRGAKPEYRILSFWQMKGQVIADPIRRAYRRMKETSRPLRRFRGSEYENWRAAELARFLSWGYRWHFGIWKFGLKNWVRLISSKLAANR